MSAVASLVLLATGYVFVAGHGSAQVSPPPAAQLPVPISPIQRLLSENTSELSGYNLDRAQLQRFYQARNFAPVWSARKDSDTALDILTRSADDGLDPAFYRLDALTARRNANAPEMAAEFDILLTASLLDYMHDLHFGRVSPESFNDVSLPQASLDTVRVLADALAAGDLAQTLAKLAPAHSEYADLKRALLRYRAIEATGGWPEIPVTARIKLDGDDERIDTLRTRLAVEDSALAATPGADPDEIRAALTRYQTRNALEVTGMADKTTLAALDVPAAARIDQIVANMERWRWLPDPFPPTYIEVNAADATLKVVDRGAVVLASRIITGKPKTPTPIFHATVIGITYNPYWNIPASILRNEILPKARRNPGYLDAENIEIGPDGNYRQRPGAKNSLGQLKLEMPNGFNSYLHDTPSKRLFARNDRHFSHGCMRVQQILPLASYALTRDAAAALDHINAMIATGVNQTVSLDKPLPVYVLYWTAIADQDGTVGFRPDVYGRDGRLLAAIAGHRPIGRVSLGTMCQSAAG